MRQEHAGLRDGDGSPQPPIGVRLRRHHSARPLARSAGGHRRGLRSRGTARGRPSPGGRPRRSRSARLPGSGIVRWDVHGQHHGLGDRSARVEPAQQLGANSCLERQTGRLHARRCGGRQVDRAQHSPARHPHPQGLRERHHDGHRARRVNQRRAAPAGDCRYRRRQADHRRLHEDRPARAGAGRPETQRAIPDGGAGSHRRAHAASQEAPRPTACCMAM